MNWKIKLFIAVAVIVGLLAVLLGLFKDSTAPNPNSNSGKETLGVEASGLTEEQKSLVVKFAKNFLSLYNTFSYEDYGNLEALGDYQTQNAQKQTLEWIEALRTQTPIGFFRTVNILESEIEAKKPLLSEGQIDVQAKFFVTDTVQEDLKVSPRSDDFPKQRVSEITATLKLVPYGKSWLVNDINISN